MSLRRISPLISTMISLFLFNYILFITAIDYHDNIVGTYAVHKNLHYSNKSSLTWGQNGDKSWNTTVSLSYAMATYDCSNTTSYTCVDDAWYYDWNKLWGKARCGYLHDHHDDSDRFVWRRCSDASCASYITNQSMIQLAAYSYDNSIPPYTGQNPELLKIFNTTIYPDTRYRLVMEMQADGLTLFSLADDGGVVIETQSVQHDNLCADNYYEGTVDGLYFGGTCAAPEDVVMTFY